MTTTGGRPKEDGGHKPLRISVDKNVSEGLSKVRNKSTFIEKTIQPVLDQMDPGPSCRNLRVIDEYLTRETTKALHQKDFEKATALTQMANSLDEYRNLCRK